MTNRRNNISTKIEKTEKFISSVSKHRKKDKIEKKINPAKRTRFNNKKKYPKKTNALPPFKADNDLIRLNKYIANTGICSRREADEFIKAGLVTVNGTVVIEMGIKVSPNDDVRYNGGRLRKEKKVYILLNKPRDFVTTSKDVHAKKTVLDLIENACKERVYPVGRLDRNTTGVLLLTNDGDLTKKLTHPSYSKKKIYHVFLDKNLKLNDMKIISDGITLDDGFFKVDEISYADPKDKKQVGIEIHSGRNRIVRRIFEHLGYTVLKLDRVYFAGLTKKGLRRGQWRFLKNQEISMLKMESYE
jgi:23S rRNA pseudouridine2605 synthase